MNLYGKIKGYLASLAELERSPRTVEQYKRELLRLAEYVGGSPVTKELLVGYKRRLTERFSPSSVNSMIAAVNGFLGYIKRGDLRLKRLRIQRRAFLPEERELDRSEYKRLVAAAEHTENKRLSLILQTICATGIRVSELRFITAEAVRTGRAFISCKGKSRVVFLPDKLRKILSNYIGARGITSGAVFVSRAGNPLDRSNVWREMKKLCGAAGVARGKVFPHNLRHLFARTYYSMEKDLSRLADFLGHSSVNTTRIYTMESGREHARQINRLGLVLNST